MQWIKDWAEVAAKLGPTVLRVFTDTQMHAQTWETISNGATLGMKEVVSNTGDIPLLCYCSFIHVNTSSIIGVSTTLPAKPVSRSGR